MAFLRWYLHEFGGTFMLLLGQALLVVVVTAQHDVVLGPIVFLSFVLAAMAHTATVWLRWRSRR